MTGPENFLSLSWTLFWLPWPLAMLKGVWGHYENFRKLPTTQSKAAQILSGYCKCKVKHVSLILLNKVNLEVMCINYFLKIYSYFLFFPLVCNYLLVFTQSVTAALWRSYDLFYLWQGKGNPEHSWPWQFLYSLLLFILIIWLRKAS